MLVRVLSIGTCALRARIAGGKLPADMRSGRGRVPVVAFGLLFAGACGGGTEDAKSAAGTRSVEITHEACDVDSGSALKTDVNNDGRPDIMKVMSGGKEKCRAVDLNFDGIKDVFIYFDDAGQERRRESDFDRDGRPDEITTLQGGVVLRKELETNFDAKLDTWEEYAGGRLAKSERDSDGDGVIDEWWDFNRPDQPKCAVVVSDRNADGLPDPDSAVDMCGEGYKPPPDPKADPVATSSAAPSASGPPPFATSSAPPTSSVAAPPSASAPHAPSAAKP